MGLVVTSTDVLQRLFNLILPSRIEQRLKKIEDLLKEIIDWVHGRRPMLLISVTVDNITVTGEHIMTEFTKPGQSAPFSVKILDARKRPAQIDGAIEVVNSNEAAASVTFDQDARTGRITALEDDTVVAGQVTFTADAKIGEGIKHIIGVLDFVVNYNEASIVEVTVGAIEEPPA